jgi:hypothetical protein
LIRLLYAAAAAAAVVAAIVFFLLYRTANEQRRIAETERRVANTEAHNAKTASNRADTEAQNARSAKNRADAETLQAQNALAANMVQEGVRAFENEGVRDIGRALAYFARALQTAPQSVVATSWMSDLLLRESWWVPVMTLWHSDSVHSAAFSPTAAASSPLPLTAQRRSGMPKPASQSVPRCDIN